MSSLRAMKNTEQDFINVVSVNARMINSDQMTTQTLNIDGPISGNTLDINGPINGDSLNINGPATVNSLSTTGPISGASLSTTGSISGASLIQGQTLNISSTGSISGAMTFLGGVIFGSNGALISKMQIASSAVPTPNGGDSFVNFSVNHNLGVVPTVVIATVSRNPINNDYFAWNINSTSSSQINFLVISSTDNTWTQTFDIYWMACA